jgi:hypothetical protein
MKWAWLFLACLVCSGCDKAKPDGAGSASAGSATGSSAEPEDNEPEDEGSAAPKAWNVGDVVQVKRDGKWHEAEIVTAGSAYKVLYTFDDQVEDGVPAARLRSEKWSKKTHVEAQVGDAWKHGTVVARHRDGASYSYEIAVDGGDTKTFTAAQVRGLRKPKSAAHSNASSSSGGGGSAPCTGPAYIMRCGGVCIDTQQDNNNCGRCGNRCSNNKHCDGHGFCREPNGDL